MKKPFILICLALLSGCTEDSASPSSGDPGGAVTITHESEAVLSDDTLEIREMDTLALDVGREGEDAGGLRFALMNEELFGAKIDAKTGAFSWIPGYETGSVAGTEYEFIFAAFDGDDFRSRGVNIRVMHRNRLPVLSLINNSVSIRNGKTEGAPPGKEAYFALLAFKDPDGDAATLDALNLPDSSVLVDSIGGHRNFAAWEITPRTGEFFLDSLRKEGMAFKGLTWIRDSTFTGTVDMAFRVADGTSSDTVVYSCAPDPREFRSAYSCGAK